MNVLHFGAGNIGRGFIGEILSKNDCTIVFVDVNEALIDQLNQDRKYTLHYADDSGEKVEVTNVSGINSNMEHDKLLTAFNEADLVTLSVGPNVLPFVAKTIYEGLMARYRAGNQIKLDVVACENMIGAGDHLRNVVRKQIADEEFLAYFNERIGFPNAAVDRIVPISDEIKGIDVLAERYSEWVIDKTEMKNQQLVLQGVNYVDDLAPYIERKLFIINTGHGAAAYTGWWLGHQTVVEAFGDQRVLKRFKEVTHDTATLLNKKWSWDALELENYIEKSIERFQNPFIKDRLSRVARTPIRKLGNRERFVRPLIELAEYGIHSNALIEVIGCVLNYSDTSDPEASQLQQMLREKTVSEVVAEICGITDESLLTQINEAYER